jgi:dipeptidase E
MKMVRKLVLYSDQVIAENAKIDQRLRFLIGTQNPKMGYIPSSSDPQRFWYKQKQSYYAPLGINLALYFEIDVNYDAQKLDELLTCDAIHLSGGNTYHFLYWLRARGLITPLHDYVTRGGLLVGTSAGAILMTPEIGTAALCGDAPLPGEEMTDLSALSLVDFGFLPHINQIESATALLKEYSYKHQSVIYGCQDGDGIIVKGDRVEYIGNFQKAIDGKLMQ